MGNMSEKELEIIAGLIAEKITLKHCACSLSDSEQQAVKDLLNTKKNAVRAFLWVCGALFLWIIKDVYIYIIGHLALK